MVKTMLAEWSSMRWLRLSIGLIILGQSIWQNDPILSLVAGSLLLLAFANAGCGCASGCNVNYTHSKKRKDIDYEEMDIK